MLDRSHEFKLSLEAPQDEAQVSRRDELVPSPLLLIVRVFPVISNEIHACRLHVSVIHDVVDMACRTSVSAQEAELCLRQILHTLNARQYRCNPTQGGNTDHTILAKGKKGSVVSDRWNPDWLAPGAASCLMYSPYHPKQRDVRPNPAIAYQ